MASQQQDTTVLLTFGGADGPQQASDSGVLWLKLGVGEQRLRRGSGSGKGAYKGGELRQSSKGSWLGLGRGVLVR
jgi:hypothetical protein